MNHLSRPAPAVFLSLSLISLLTATAAQAAPELKWTTKQLTKDFYAEGAAVGDFNKDGVKDVAYGPYWFAGPGFTEKHRIYEPKAFDPHGYSRNFLTYGPDLNNDGWSDVLVLGFPGEDSYWFENPKGADGDWKRHEILKVTDGESPAWLDITGDGKPEIVCAQNGAFGYASPGEDPSQPWPFVAVTTDKASSGRFTHGMGVGDVNGDGKPDLLEKNGWWEQPADPRTQPVWTFHPEKFSEGGGAQMYAYDFDGDGDNDVFTSLAAHAYGLAWYEQVKDAAGKISFVKHELMPTDPKAPSKVPVYSQIHAIDLADINGDGIKDLVAGRRYWAHPPTADGKGGDPGVNDPAVLYWYEVKRGGKSGEAEFIPHLIDDKSGVGTQVTIAEMDGKAPAEIVVGNKLGAFVSSATFVP